MRRFVLLVMCMTLAISQLWAQTRTITGKVTDEKGAPLVGATVSASGSNAKTVTNAEGNFSLIVPANARSLVISYVGFQDFTAPLTTSSSAVTVSMTPAGDLEGVVVTGYGRTKRSTYSGAAARVDRKVIEAVPMGSFDQILQGRVPGLVVTSTSGQPGAAATVMLRGMTSILGGSTPLYVVDGIPVEASVFQSYNPNDFESVDVLKDAAASALYGSRGAAGVIVVTTKRGRGGRTVLNYRVQGGITQPGKQQFEMMNSSELLQFQEKLGTVVPGTNLPGWTLSPNNPANASLPAAQQAANARALDSLRGIDTDWRDVFFRQGSFSSHDLNLSGGTDRTRFFASVGTYKEEGIALRSDLDRKTFRLNLDHTTDKLTLSLNSGVGYSTRQQIESEGGAYLANPFAAVYLSYPYQRVYNDFGGIDVGPGKVGANALQRAYDTEFRIKQLKGNLNASATYNLTENIYVGGQAGADFRNTRNEIATRPASFTAFNSAFPIGPSVAGDTSTARGTYLETDRSQFAYQTRAFVGYKKLFGSKHSFDGNINVEYLKSTTRGVGIRVYGLNPRLPITAANFTTGNINNQLIPAASNTAPTDTRLFSTFGVFKYIYNDKYTFDVTVRNDNSSLLPESNRSKFFYAVGANWNVMKETFTASWKNVSSLRLRASYGTSANANNFPLGQGAYLSTFGQGSYAGLPTWVEGSPGNPNADWEYTKQFNAGVDFGFFANRLTGSLDFYNKNTDNLFLIQPVSSVTGITAAIAVNSGVMRNRGIEAQISYDVIRSRKLTWNIGGNFSYNQNRIVNLAGAPETFTDGWGIAKEGYPYGSFYLTKWGGVDAANGAPLYYTKEGKLTATYSDDDAVIHGTYLAPRTGGFNTSVTYNGFELSAFFSFQHGNYKFNRQNFFLGTSQLNYGYNLLKDMLTMWTKPGDVTNYQSPNYSPEIATSKYLEDASFLRFRNLQVAYNIPRSVLGRQNVISSIRVFGQAQNLYTWTKFTGFDPEAENVTDFSADDAAFSYPAPRTYTIGVNVIF